MYDEQFENAQGIKIIKRDSFNRTVYWRYTIILDKIEMKKDIYGKPSILKIIDEGKLAIHDLIGPEIPDQNGRFPGDPHYNHSH